MRGAISGELCLLGAVLKSYTVSLTLIVMGLNLPNTVTLMLWLTANHKIILLLLCNCNFAAVMSSSINNLTCRISDMSTVPPKGL